MQVKAEKTTDTVGTFVVEPLLPGFGLTVGNALRRVLLSSLPGAAITSIRIDGVAHEFTTIKGVRQDVVDIILNLKQVRLKVESTEPQVIILDVKGEKTAKAGDFKCPTGVSIINKDMPIADLIAGGKLLLEATVEQGRGYVPTEMRKDEKLPIGVIAIDSAYSPVKRVNFNTENTRVGKMTNFDRLILEIETDGSITPQQALEQSSAVLVDHFSVIAGGETAVSANQPVAATSDEVVETTEDTPKAKKSVKKAAK